MTNLGHKHITRCGIMRSIQTRQNPGGFSLVLLKDTSELCLLSQVIQVNSRKMLSFFLFVRKGNSLATKQACLQRKFKHTLHQRRTRVGFKCLQKEKQPQEHLHQRNQLYMYANPSLQLSRILRLKETSICRMCRIRVYWCTYTSALVEITKLEWRSTYLPHTWLHVGFCFVDFGECHRAGDCVGVPL